MAEFHVFYYTLNYNSASCLLFQIQIIQIILNLVLKFWEVLWAFCDSIVGLNMWPQTSFIS